MHGATGTCGCHSIINQNNLICKLNQITLTLIVVQTLGAGHSTKGIAHIGAIDAIKDLELDIDCVFILTIKII